MKTPGEFQSELTRFVSPWEKRLLHIYEHPDSDEVLVRAEKAFFSPEHMELQSEYAQLFDELWQDYGIEHAGRVHMLVESKRLLVITERVEGVRLDVAAQQQIPGAVEALTSLYEAITLYCEHKITSGAPRLTDIESSYQYIYDTNKRAAILVDVDSFASGKQGDNSYLLELAALYDSVFHDSASLGLPATVLQNVTRLILRVDKGAVKDPRFRRGITLLHRIVHSKQPVTEQDFEQMYWG
jgi:hypothetical protein